MQHQKCSPELEGDNQWNSKGRGRSFASGHWCDSLYCRFLILQGSTALQQSWEQQGCGRVWWDAGFPFEVLEIWMLYFCWWGWVVRFGLIFNKMVSKIFDKLKKKLRPVLKDTFNVFFKEIRIFQHEKYFWITFYFENENNYWLCYESPFRIDQFGDYFLEMFWYYWAYVFCLMQKWAKNFPTTGLICEYFINRSFICWKYWENWAVSTKSYMDIAEK